MERPAENNELANRLDEALSQRKYPFSIFVVGAGISLIWLFALVHSPPEEQRLYLVALLPVVGGFSYARQSFSRRLGDLVMPVVLSSVFGMTYRPRAHHADIEFLIRVGLLPKNGHKTLHAEAVGRVRGYFLRVWGVTTLLVRRRRKAIYRTYVCEYPAKPEWVGLTLVPADFPRWLRTAVEGLEYSEVAYPGVRGLAQIKLLRTADGAPPLRDLIRRIRDSNQLFRDQAVFAGICFERDRTLLVIRDHSLPLQLFGLFKSREQILTDLSARLGELAIPLRLAEIWELGEQNSAGEAQRKA